MPCNLLLDPLPVQDIAGNPIRSDFRQMVQFEQLTMNRQLTPEEKVMLGLELFYPNGYGPLTKAQAWAQLLWFYQCGRQPKSNGRSGKEPLRGYDFDVDHALICAAFEQAYHIDLTTVKMHWWRFRALLDYLPADCRLVKIMEYRTADLDDLPEKVQAYYRKMRSLYAIDQHSQRLPLTVEQHEQGFIERLRRKPNG